jgi:hypothetical protein
MSNEPITRKKGIRKGGSEYIGATAQIAVANNRVKKKISPGDPQFSDYLRAKLPIRFVPRAISGRLTGGILP